MFAAMLVCWYAGMLVCCYYMLLYLDPSRLDCNLAQPWHRCPGRYNLRIGRPSPRESAEPIRDSGFEAWPTSDPAVMSAANVCGKCLRSIQVYLLIAQQQNSDVIVFRPLDLFDQHVKHLVRTWHCNMVIEISELRRHSKTINASNIFKSPWLEVLPTSPLSDCGLLAIQAVVKIVRLIYHQHLPSSGPPVSQCREMPRISELRRIVGPKAIDLSAKQSNSER